MSRIQRHRSRDGLDEQALYGSADPPLEIPQHRFRTADSRRAEAGTPVETDPLTHRGTVQRHRDIRIDENIRGEVELGGDPVAEVANRRRPLPRRGVFARHHRAPQPEPCRGRPQAVEPSLDKADLDTLVVKGPIAIGHMWGSAVSYTHLRAHETDSYLVCRLLLEKKK